MQSVNTSSHSNLSAKSSPMFHASSCPWKKWSLPHISIAYENRSQCFHSTCVPTQMIPAFHYPGTVFALSPCILAWEMRDTQCISQEHQEGCITTEVAKAAMQTLKWLSSLAATIHNVHFMSGMESIHLQVNIQGTQIFAVAIVTFPARLYCCREILSYNISSELCSL